MNLFDALLELSRRLTTTREGTATAVSTTSITDTTKEFANGELNGGTIFLKDTTSKMLRIVSNGGDVIRFATQASATSAGVGYAVAPKTYPLDVLLASVNTAIKDVYAKTDQDSSLVTDNTKTDYTLPAGVSEILQVEVETQIPYHYTNSPTYYAASYTWHEVDGELRFISGTEPRTDGMTIRLTYRVRPSELSSATADLPPVDYELLLWKAATHALRWGLQRYGQDPDKRIVDLLNEAQQEVARRGGNKRTYQKQIRTGAW